MSSLKLAYDHVLVDLWHGPAGLIPEPFTGRRRTRATWKLPMRSGRRCTKK
jgi:hypothetical protein